MAKFFPIALVSFLAAAQPAAAFTWTLGPPPPLPLLPREALGVAISSLPQALPPLPPLPNAPAGNVAEKPSASPLQVSQPPRWQLVQTTKPRWEIVSRPASTPAASVSLASANPRWERVPAHERIHHSQILAIVATPDPMELVQLDRPALRWESVPAPQPTYAAYGSTESSAVRPVLGRRVWFRF
jgi:hypothetical protein